MSVSGGITKRSRSQACFGVSKSLNVGTAGEKFLSFIMLRLCVNVDHFNLFFIYLGKYTFSLEIFELNHFICQESLLTDHLSGM